MTSRAVYNDRTALELVGQAAEAVRGLNHLTRDDSGLQSPAEVHQALGLLTLMCERLPQALQQIEALLQDWVEAGAVSIEGGEFAGDPEAAAAVTSVYLLEEAAPAAQRLYEQLDRAQQALAFASFTDDQAAGE